MKHFAFNNPKFIQSATKLEQYPKLTNQRGTPLPEIAVAGRSNVGKSSLLNNLFQTKHLVKTSSTPGKTQLVNFFTLNDELAFADLPGYGYAKVSLEVKKNWGPMVQEYLEGRRELKLILFLLDIRRIPNEDDLQLLDWILHYKKATILVLTKIDKVTTSELKSQTQKILEAIDGSNIPYTHYSILKKVGREKLITLIEQHVS